MSTNLRSIAILADVERGAWDPAHRPSRPLPTPVLNLIDGLRVRAPDLRITVISVERRTSGLHVQDVTRNLRHVSLPAWRGDGVLTGFRPRVLRIHRLLRAVRPSIVHGQGFEREYAYAAATSGFPCVITSHGSMREVLNGQGVRRFSHRRVPLLLERAALRQHPCVIAVSDAAASYLKQRGAMRVTTIPNAIGRGYFADRPAMPHHALTLTSIGTIYPLKRTDVVLEAASRLHSMGHKVHVNIIGSFARSTAKEYADRLDALEKRLPSGTVTWHGWLGPREIRSVLASTTCLVHMSQEESGPMSVVEALASGVPFIGSRTGVMPHLADQGGGFVTAPQAQGVAEAALAIAAALPDRRSLSRLAEPWHPDVVADATLGVYEAALQ